MYLSGKSDATSQKDFWDGLQSEILFSNQNLKQEDYMSIVERSFMFSLFFRNYTNLEQQGFRNILNIKDNGYIILIEFYPMDKTNNYDLNLDDLELHHFLKKQLQPKYNNVSPLISNRVCILITEDDLPSGVNEKNESIGLCRGLLHAIETELHVTAIIGIGQIQSFHSIYSSLVEALTCIYYGSPREIIHIQNLSKKNLSQQFDYVDTEKHLLEAIRTHKTEAYDFFTLMMEHIRPFSDNTKRNKILEILVLSAHALRLDSQTEMDLLNYTGRVKEFMELTGDQLIEFAYQRFISITGYVRPQNSIDYTNHIVQATKLYLEEHYAEDISLEVVAEQVNISPQYFSKLIKKTTGFNFIDWLSMLRVKKAKELLTNSNYTVKEVCFMVGYKDPNYFSRIFKKRIGITPSEYVKNISYLNNKN
jgi:two-component system, response regulator YesN